MARERKSREEWRRIVARLRASDWTPEYFANRHNLSLNTHSAPVGLAVRG